MALAAVLLLFQQTGYSDKPARIISLDLCTDWMLLKYASRSQVLAYSPLLYRYATDWVAHDLPVHSGDLEQIVALNPELLITGEYNATGLRKRLKQLGFRVEVLSLPHDIDSIEQYRHQFLSLIRDDVEQTLDSAEYLFPKKNKRLLLLGANGIGTGRGTFEDDVLQAAGWDNYLQQPGYISLQIELLITNPPDAIYWSAPRSSSLANLFAQHPAISKMIGDEQQGRDENWRWQCPGPWTYELIEELSQWKGT